MQRSGGGVDHRPVASDDRALCQGPIAAETGERGGRLDVGAEIAGNRTEIVIRAEGPRLVLDPELRTALQGHLDEKSVTPRAAAAWLVHKLADDSGGAIQVSDPAEPFLVFGVTLGNG